MSLADWFPRVRGARIANRRFAPPRSSAKRKRPQLFVERLEARELLAANLSLSIITWDTIGLDSNKPSIQGPDTFPLGVRVTNTGNAAATNMNAQLLWDTASANINLAPGDQATLSVPSLAVNASQDFYWN